MIDAAPAAEWRLLIALARYGGLRIPSEPLSLRWSDVDWQRNRVRIWSPKTEHHDGKASRLIPLFGELRPYLEAAFELADPGTEYVISRHRPRSIRREESGWQHANLSTTFRRIIERAGVEARPRLWNNLRSSRETELTRIPGLGLQTVVAWMGNSETVAMKHYLQVTDRDYEHAIEVTESWSTENRSENRSGTAPYQARTVPQAENDEFHNSVQRKKKRRHAKTCDRSIWRIGDRLHDSPDDCGATHYDNPDSAESDNVAKTAAILRADPRLADLIHKWLDLPQSVQDCIVLLTEANQHTGQ